VTGSEVRDLLARYGLAARKDLGQNFLVDAQLARKLVRRAGVGADETVLEIGTGLGILTRALAERSRRVVSLEVDAGLVRALRSEGELPAHVDLVQADALEVDLAGLLPAHEPARLVANLPYSIASPLLRRILDLRGRLRGWSVLLQREVANRLKAEPGSRDYGSLAVLHRLTVRVDGSLPVGPRCFYPVPRVVSSFVTLSPRVEPLLDPGELAGVERVVRAVFRHRRKTLLNSLRAAEPDPRIGERAEGSLLEQGIDPRARAEILTPEQHLHLARALAEGLRPVARAPAARAAP
jgi:16S rRNA (adenine1518-N6/adenine1519-N6)-dimethyltransferase